MDINDYSARLANSRNRFAEVQQELKDTYDENVRNLEKNHAQKSKNQRESFVNQKLKMEEESQDRLTRYDRNLQDELSNRTERYNKNLSGERKRFSEDRKRLMADYNQKLSSISKSFDTSSGEKDKLHALYKDNIMERYEEGLTNREKDFNSKLGTLNETATTKINDYRDLTNREKTKLITDFGNERKQLVQDANISRNKANSRHQIEMERLREAGKQNETTLKNNFESANTALRQTKNNQIEGQRETFEDLSKNIQERNQSELTKLNRQSKAEKRDLERQFAGDRLELERKTNSLLNEGSANKVEDSRKTLLEQHASQVKNLKDAIESNNHSQSLQNERLAGEHSNEIKQIEVRHNTSIDKKNDELRKIRENEVAKQKDKFNKYQEMMSKRNTRLEKEGEQQQVVARKKMTNALDQQRTDFSRQINQINIANEKAFSDARKAISEEQTKLIEKTKRDSHHEIASVKEDLKTSFTLKEESLNKKITSAQKDKMKMEEAYQNKIDVLKHKSAKEIESLKILEHEKRISEREASEEQMIQQRREYQKTFMSLRKEADRKIARAKASKDLSMTKLTQRYEGQLERERTEHKSESDRQKKLMTKNYNNLLHKTNLERDNLVNQYELKIDKLREANRLASEMRSLSASDKKA